MQHPNESHPNESHPNESHPNESHPNESHPKACSTGPVFDEDPARTTIEAGLFAGLREWIDLLPGLRLHRVLRLGGSWSTIGLAWVAVEVWRLAVPGLLSIFDSGGVELAGDSGSDQGGMQVESVWGLGPRDGVLSVLVRSVSVAGDANRLAALVVFTVFLFTPVMMLGNRLGARLVAGRNPGDLLGTLRLVRRRTPRGWLLLVFPFLLAAPVWGAIFLSVHLGDLVGTPWSSATSLLAFLLGLCAGVPLFYGIFGIPLAIAALVNESSADCFDAASRGYEYALRRPAHLLGYAVLGVVFGAIAVVVNAGIAVAASVSVTAIGGQSETAGLAVAMLQSWVVAAVLVTVGGVTGGVYLLMRRAAGGQEVEDLWIDSDSPESGDSSESRESSGR